MTMTIKYPATNGACPVNVEVKADERCLVIEWAGAQLCLPIEEIREIVKEEDDLK